MIIIIIACHPTMCGVVIKNTTHVQGTTYSSMYPDVKKEVLQRSGFQPGTAEKQTRHFFIFIFLVACVVKCVPGTILVYQVLRMRT